MTPYFNFFFGTPHKTIREEKVATMVQWSANQATGNPKKKEKKSTSHSQEFFNRLRARSKKN